MENKVYSLIADVLGISKDKINDSLEMKDIESWDSLRHMELITSIENFFSIELNIDEILKMNSIKGIIKVLEEKNLN
ncbi:MAG: acyl carrier protein [Cyanobacteriota bacterium]